jgi:hypothetical protein
MQKEIEICLVFRKSQHIYLKVGPLCLQRELKGSADHILSRFIE